MAGGRPRDCPDLIYARGAVGRAYMAVRRRGLMLERACADGERILGPGHPLTLTALDSLGNACVLAGRHGEAIRLLKQVVADCERALGYGDRITGPGR